MEISVNSWHYKILNAVGIRPRTLCTYFWWYMFLIFCAFVVAPAALVGLYVGPYVLFFMEEGISIQALVQLWNLPNTGWMSILLIFTMLCGLFLWVAIIFVVGTILFSIGEYLWWKCKKYSPKVHKPSIIAQRWEAHKEKYCPIITYTKD